MFKNVQLFKNLVVGTNSCPNLASSISVALAMAALGHFPSVHSLGTFEPVTYFSWNPSWILEA